MTAEKIGHLADRKDDDRRFAFGDNWLDFARDLSADQIAEAETSLRTLLQRDNLAGASFVDVGSGSGLFSLAARRLGARVHSFDYDMDCVLCTRRLRELHFDGDPDWTTERGSVLDPDYIGGLGTFDREFREAGLDHLFDGVADLVTGPDRGKARRFLVDVAEQNLPNVGCVLKGQVAR